ncbi:hypothetical protein F5884DRAFT_888471 [Xylogone sp. PMI_703]|nr:hypothetical protein F5884DRAFT_888471 [Xylogone sp. PMI_703]
MPPTKYIVNIQHALIFNRAKIGMTAYTVDLDHGFEDDYQRICNMADSTMWRHISGKPVPKPIRSQRWEVSCSLEGRPETSIKCLLIIRSKYTDCFEDPKRCKAFLEGIIQDGYQESDDNEFHTRPSKRPRRDTESQPEVQKLVAQKQLPSHQSSKPHQPNFNAASLICSFGKSILADTPNVINRRNMQEAIEIMLKHDLEPSQLRELIPDRVIALNIPFGIYLTLNAHLPKWEASEKNHTMVRGE